MGDKKRTIQNLEIIKSDLENNLIFVKGSIPGAKNSVVLIKKNEKNIKRISSIDKYRQVKPKTIETKKSDIKNNVIKNELSQKSNNEKKPIKNEEKK